MSDMLSIGSSALMAYSSALNVVSQNIANASTPGYSRQRVEFQANNWGGVGAGVSVRTVTRLSDYLVYNRLVGQDSSFSRISIFNAMASSTDSWLSGSSTGLSGPLQGFFDALNSLGSTASSTASRQVVLEEAQTLASRFKDLQANFNQSDRDVDAQLADSVSQINTLASQVASLNQRIAEASTTQPGQTPNELLDQRDQLVRQLSEQVGIKTTIGDDGSVNVSLGTGQALVLGNQASTLSVAKDAFGRPREIMLATQGGTPSSITNQISGGVIGGLLDYRREVLDPAAARLGAMATAFAAAMNAQHAKGMDQYGEQGGVLFTMPTGTATAATTNTGSAQMSMTLTDASAAGTSDYVVSYDGATWTMTNSTTGATVPLSGSGTADDPLVGAGVSLTLDGTVAAGDQFLVQPTRYAAGQIDVAITDPARLAVAGPIRTTVSADNTGAATIGTPTVDDYSNPALLESVTIEFIDATHYSINGQGSYDYTSGGDISYNGWTVQVSGVPAAGDSFMLSQNDGSSGDNGNAVAMAAIADLGILDGGRTSIFSANSALVTQVGSQAAQSEVQLQAQDALRTQTQSERDSLSGVNLDEEAADLMRYQQAYQAAAQIISTANTLFNTLLTSVQR
jgi:flagellar hook-associated protein 1 FlgK